MIPSVPMLFNKISTIICDGSFLWYTHNSCDMMNMRGKLWYYIKKKKVTGSCSHSHYAKLLSRPTSLNIGLGLFLFTSDHFILFFTKSHVRRLIFLVQIFYINYVINVNMLCTTFNAEPNRCIDLKKNDVPTRAVYFTNEFLIVIQIR